MQQSALARLEQAHARMVTLSHHPHWITAYAGTLGATEASALDGAPDRIAAALEALRAVGVRHLLLDAGQPTTQSNSASPATIRADLRDGSGFLRAAASLDL